ncbi:MAG: DUF1566 domain-containing protein [Deltaproteobacteria bacterium]|nr:DUF1566 domain-containing protein [Deltaproteobacteria bacterium]MBF0524887.1 DUF1566 domain-containing protein [Deltaproteobacteria bacterium]
MNRDTGRVSPYLLIVFMLGCLACYSSFPVYAGELPASRPSCFTCKGSLSPQGRWCDNNNGTVTDMSTGLVWLKDASWGGLNTFWMTTKTATNAADRAAQTKNGNPASLTDGSQEGDWGLPTISQLASLAVGTEAIYCSNHYTLDMYFFSGVHIAEYWSSTTYSADTNTAQTYFFNTQSGTSHYDKNSGHYVWPVRIAK